MAPPPPPYAQVIVCGVCKSRLTITALREDTPRTSTKLDISCPVCKTESDVVAPLGIIASSVQIVFFERPTVKPNVKRV